MKKKILVVDPFATEDTVNVLQTIYTGKAFVTKNCTIGPFNAVLVSAQSLLDGYEDEQKLRELCIENGKVIAMSVFAESIDKVKDRVDDVVSKWDRIRAIDDEKKKKFLSFIN